MSDPPVSSPASSPPTSPPVVSPTWDLLFADWGQQAPLAIDTPLDDHDEHTEDQRFMEQPAIPIVVTGRELQADTHGYRQTVLLTALARATDLVDPFTSSRPLDRTRLALQIDDAWHECLDRLDLGTGLVRLTMRPADIPLGPVVETPVDRASTDAGQWEAGQ